MAQDALHEQIKSLMPQAWEDLSRAVSFRSVADGSEPEECEQMVEWTVDAFSGVGVQDVRAYKTTDGSKTVTGQVTGAAGGARRSSSISITTSSRQRKRAGSLLRGS